MARLVIVFLLPLIFFAAVRPGPFFAVRTWCSWSSTSPEFGLMSLGVMFTMFTAGIDLVRRRHRQRHCGICAALTLRAKFTGPATASSMGMVSPIALGVAPWSSASYAASSMASLVAILKIRTHLRHPGTSELFGGAALVLNLEGKPVPACPQLSSTTAMW